MKWTHFIPIIRRVPPLPHSHVEATELGFLYFSAGWPQGFRPPGMDPHFLPSYLQGFNGAIFNSAACQCRRIFLASWN